MYSVLLSALLIIVLCSVPLGIFARSCTVQPGNLSENCEGSSGVNETVTVTENCQLTFLPPPDGEKPKRVERVGSKGLDGWYTLAHDFIGLVSGDGFPISE